MPQFDARDWDLFLRGAVAAVLLFHAVNLALYRARPAARIALIGLVLSAGAYLFCQHPETLLRVPRTAAIVLLVLCVGTTAWLWLAARALFDDGFHFTTGIVLALLAMEALGLAANLPYFPDDTGPFRSFAPGSMVRWLGVAHDLAMLGFSAAALWALTRGWRADLVETRRVIRRWVVLGIGVYSALALVVEIALRGQEVGLLLPALHVAGIGTIAMAAALFVAHRSLDEVLGIYPIPLPPPAPPIVEGADAEAAPPTRESAALAQLTRAMEVDRAYRQDGLTLGALAATLDMSEAALRHLINRRLGFRNFNDYLHQYRLRDAAARLASEDLPVLTIALDCGYGSIGPFNRAFKVRFGRTPTEYRAEARLARGNGVDRPVDATNRPAI